MKSIHAQLEELGLGEKEVKVYLASLELGSSAVQDIAGKSGIVRSSVYVAIGGLTQRGLMSSFKKGKKEFYTAEPPEHLLHLLRDKKRKLLDQEAKLKAAMPELQALISLSVEKPEVKYYEGLEGLEAMREKIFESKAKEIRVIGSISEIQRIVPEEMRALHSIKIRKAQIHGKQIIISDSNTTLPEIVPEGWKFKTMKSNDGNLAGEIAIFNEFISLTAYQDKPYGFLLKSRTIASTSKQLFDATWKNIKLRDLRK